MQLHNPRSLDWAFCVWRYLYGPGSVPQRHLTPVHPERKSAEAINLKTAPMLKGMRDSKSDGYDNPCRFESGPGHTTGCTNVDEATAAVAHIPTFKEFASAKIEELLPHPRFRTHKRRGKNGQTWTSYFYDMRGTGKPDIPLGTDFDKAAEQWRAIRSGERIVRQQKLKKRTAGKRRKQTGIWTDFPVWAKSMYFNAERRSHEVDRVFTLSIDEFWAVIRRANGACELTGIPFDAGQRSPFSPSIDRINSFEGYAASNVRLVCLIANCAMSNWGEEPLRVLARYLVERSAP